MSIKRHEFEVTPSLAKQGSDTLYEETKRPKGAQRLSVERLQRWEALKYGMFIHYGLTTFTERDKHTGMEDGDMPLDIYNPTQLDVEQWVKVAVDAGMRYAVLTAKHCTGFALWPTKHSDYHVGNTSAPTDVVGAFVDACRKHGIKPGLYFNGDRHNMPEEQIETGEPERNYCTQKFLDFCMAQLEELLTQYGELETIWFDGPYQYGHIGRLQLYEYCASLQPEIVVVNSSMWKANDVKPTIRDWSWPTDVVNIESGTPPLYERESAWRRIAKDRTGARLEEELDYYIPVECCCLGQSFNDKPWFWGPETKALPMDELLGKRLLCRARNANFLLNATPDTRGLIPDDQAMAFRRLREIMDSLPLDEGCGEA